MRKGSTHSAEALLKISNSKKGIPNLKRRGYKYTAEQRKRVSDGHKGYKPNDKQRATLLYYSTGKNSFNWKGGISSNKEYRNWQKNQWHHRKRAAEGSHTFREWQELKARYNWTCPACGKKEPEIKLTLDHIIPLSKGGSDNIENIQPLCKYCNCRKHTSCTRY